MLRRVFVAAAVLVIGGYLLLSRPIWLAELERQVEIGRDPLYSDLIDLSRAQDFDWQIPTVPWSQWLTDARLSLEVDSAGCKGAASDTGESVLRIKVQATGLPDSGGEYDRLVRNWYYQTDEPFEPGVRMWRSRSSNGDDYGLAGVITYPFEKLSVTLKVLTPDPRLASCRARMKLVGEHDYAVEHHLPPLRLLRDAGIGLSLVCLSYLGVLAWRRVR
jgi:hypothetical protein